MWRPLPGLAFGYLEVLDRDGFGAMEPEGDAPPWYPRPALFPFAMFMHFSDVWDNEKSFAACRQAPKGCAGRWRRRPAELHPEDFESFYAEFALAATHPCWKGANPRTFEAVRRKKAARVFDMAFPVRVLLEAVRFADMERRPDPARVLEICYFVERTRAEEIYLL
jgi:hypothetical protein